MVELLWGLRQKLQLSLAPRTHPLVGAPSFSVCTIRGGVAVNVIPDYCEIEVDRRTVPGESLESITGEIEESIRAIAASYKIDVDIESPFIVDPPLDTPGDSPIVRQLGEAIDAIVGKHAVVGVPFGTDASKLSHVGVPTVVFGPGDIDLAHTRDESIALEEVAQATEILATTALLAAS
jgi:acetylornithine deacetylase